MEQTAKPAAGTATPAKSQAIDALIGEWSITEVAGKNIVVNGEDHPKITFAQVAGHDDMLRVIGFNGCNYINGDWQFSGDAVRPAGEFISSLRACPDAPTRTTSTWPSTPSPHTGSSTPRTSSRLQPARW